MNVDDFTSKFKNGDIIKVGEYILIFARTQEIYSRFRQGLMNAIMYYALTADNESLTSDPYMSISIEPRTGIGYVEDYADTYVGKVDNKKKKLFLEAIARRGYRWDAENRQFIHIEHGEV